MNMCQKAHGKTCVLLLVICQRLNSLGRNASESERIRNLADLIIGHVLKIDSCQLAHETNEDSDDGCESSMLINGKGMSLN